MGVCATIFPVGNPDIMTLLGSNDSQVNGLPDTGFDRCSTSVTQKYNNLFVVKLKTSYC